MKLRTSRHKSKRCSYSLRIRRAEIVECLQLHISQIIIMISAWQKVHDEVKLNYKIKSTLKSRTCKLLSKIFIYQNHETNL